MKLLILQESSSYSLKRILEETINFQDISIEHVKYSDLTIHIDNHKGVVVSDTNGKDIVSNYDRFIFRSSQRADGIRYSQISKTIKYLIKEKGKYSLNEDYTRLDNGEISKIHNSIVLAQNNIPVVESRIYLDKSNVNETIFPVIAKHTRSSHGKGVTLIKDKLELDEFVRNSKNISKILFQDFIQSIDSKNDKRFDIRVIVLGNKVIGAMKKSVGQEKVITNYDAGGIVEKFEVSEEINDLCLKACDILELDYAGIDIIFENNQPLILEVNPAAQFEGFEKATGLNVAREILKFIIEK